MYKNDDFDIFSEWSINFLRTLWWLKISVSHQNFTLKLCCFNSSHHVKADWFLGISPCYDEHYSIFREIKNHDKVLWKCGDRSVFHNEKSYNFGKMLFYISIMLWLYFKLATTFKRVHIMNMILSLFVFL